MILPSVLFAFFLGLVLGLIGYSQAEDRAFRRFLNAEYRSTYVHARSAEDCQ